MIVMEETDYMAKELLDLIQEGYEEFGGLVTTPTDYAMKVEYIISMARVYQRSYNSVIANLKLLQEDRE